MRILRVVCVLRGYGVLFFKQCFWDNVFGLFCRYALHFYKRVFGQGFDADSGASGLM